MAEKRASNQESVDSEKGMLKTFGCVYMVDELLTLSDSRVAIYEVRISCFAISVVLDKESIKSSASSSSFYIKSLRWAILQARKASVASAEGVWTAVRPVVLVAAVRQFLICGTIC